MSASVPAVPAIVCEGLSKVYAGSVRAVDHLNLVVYQGECFGLLGPNGAGKTTTIEILEGLLEPTSGKVEVLGMTWEQSKQALREVIGVSLQETHFFPKLTVLETLRLFRSFYPQGPSVEELVRKFELGEKSRALVEGLSGGQKQRLALACALAGNPKLLFLDEPTTGLDPQSRRALWEQIQLLKSEGRTIVLTTHYMEEAERLCDRIAIVNQGKVNALGTLQELLRSHGGHLPNPNLEDVFVHLTGRRLQDEK